MSEHACVSEYTCQDNINALFTALPEATLGPSYPEADPRRKCFRRGIPRPPSSRAVRARVRQRHSKAQHSGKVCSEQDERRRSLICDRHGSGTVEGGDARRIINHALQGSLENELWCAEGRRDSLGMQGRPVSCSIVPFSLRVNRHAGRAHELRGPVGKAGPARRAEGLECRSNILLRQ